MMSFGDQQAVLITSIENNTENMANLRYLFNKKKALPKIFNINVLIP